MGTQAQASKKALLSAEAKLGPCYRSNFAAGLPNLRVSPDTHRTHDDTFKAEAPRLASENRSPQAAARVLGMHSTLLYCWQW